MSCPKEQKRARNPPKTANQARGLLFTLSSAAGSMGVSACSVLFRGEGSHLVSSQLDLRGGSDGCFSVSAMALVVVPLDRTVGVEESRRETHQRDLDL